MEFIKAIKHNGIYHLIENDRTDFFVYGEGHQKIAKSKIEEIPKLPFEINDEVTYQLDYMHDFIKKNEKDLRFYIKKYGVNIVNQQLDIRKQDYASTSTFNYLDYFQMEINTSKNIVKFMDEWKSITEQLKILIKEISNQKWSEEDDKDLFDWRTKEISLDSFILYSHLSGTFHIKGIESDKSVIAYIAKELKKRPENKEVNDLMVVLNNASKGLGTKIDKAFEFYTYIENLELQTKSKEKKKGNEIK